LFIRDITSSAAVKQIERPVSSHIGQKNTRYLNIPSTNVNSYTSVYFLPRSSIYKLKHFLYCKSDNEQWLCYWNNTVRIHVQDCLAAFECQYSARSTWAI